MTSSDEAAPPSAPGVQGQSSLPPAGQPPILRPRFPAVAWDPEAKAQAALADFLIFDWRAAAGLAEPPADDQEEAAALKGRMAERTARLGEIVAQDSDTLPDWVGLLGSPDPFPWTVAVLLAARGVGRVLAMYHKRTYARVRPYQLVPDLAPSISLPKTPSYPGVHATEAHLMAAALSHVLPQQSDAAKALAARIAENREIAGVNYPSDNLAGQSLAAAIWAVLQNANGFAQMLAAAQGEWPDNGNTAKGTFDPDEDGGGGGW